jgi:hypothetical protein
LAQPPLGAAALVCEKLPTEGEIVKYIKFLGLAATALTALMAMAGTASATILTSPSGTTYTATIVAENEGTVSTTSVFGGFGALTCKKSAIEAKVAAHGSTVTVTGEVTN